MQGNTPKRKRSYRQQRSKDDLHVCQKKKKNNAAYKFMEVCHFKMPILDMNFNSAFCTYAYVFPFNWK